jgi:hypothetical protein
VRRAASLGLLIALAVGGSACGARPRDMSDAAQHRLSTLVTRVRTTADARDAVGAGQALSDLRRAVSGYEQAGSLSRARGAEILGAATRVQAELALITTTTATTTTLPPEPDGPPDEHDHGKHHGDHHGQQGNGD